jgi:hypothetical protein
MSDRQRRYRERLAARRRIWKPELAVAETEQMLLDLDYLDGMTEYTKADTDTALANLVEMLVAVTGNNPDFENLLLLIRDWFESHRDDLT